MRNLYNALAKANGLEAERRTDLINEQGKKTITPEEESARARKGLHLAFSIIDLLLTVVAEQHPIIKEQYPNIKELPEYKEAMEWYNTFEGIKADVDAELKG